MRQLYLRVVLSSQVLHCLTILPATDAASTCRRPHDVNDLVTTQLAQINADLVLGSVYKKPVLSAGALMQAWVLQRTFAA